MKISIIVAFSQNRAIGNDNKLLWKLPADMKYFKQKTTGHHILVGRKTFESFGKGLKDRFCLVLTKQPNYETNPAAGLPMPTIEQAIDYAQLKGEKELFIIGGGELYRQALKSKYVDTLYITEVQATYLADTYFPYIDLTDWQLISKSVHCTDDKNEYALEFKSYKRK